MVIVFFDMDGVLSDFVGGALKHHNRDDLDRAGAPWGLESHLGLTPEQFWSSLGYEFWRDLLPLADGFALLGHAERLVGRDNVALLSSPCDTPGCADGKRDWVRRHLPEYRRRLFLGSAKEMFAGPTKILVDDHDGNVEKFRRAGGRAVMPPRPWNRDRDLCVAGGDFFIPGVCDALGNAVSAVLLHQEAVA